MDKPLTQQVIAEFAQECKGADVEAVLLGGAACFALGSARVTKDVDVVIPTPVDDKIEKLVKYSNKFKYTTDDQGIPAFTFEDVEIDAFDPQVWPNRPQYEQFLAPGGHISVNIRGTDVQVVHPTLILREKLISFGERVGPKHDTDGQDVTFLILYCKNHGFELDISKEDEEGIDKAARESLLKFMDEYNYTPEQREELNKVIKW